MPLAHNSDYFNKILMLRKENGDLYTISVYLHMDNKEKIYFKTKEYMIAYLYFLALHKRLDPKSFKYNFVDSASKQKLTIENWWLNLKNIIGYNRGRIP